MSWMDLLATPENMTRVLPWIGGRVIVYGSRTWNLMGQFPMEYGWHTFTVSGNRSCEWVPSADTSAPPDDLETENPRRITGFMIGDRMIPDNAKITFSGPDELFRVSELIWFIEPGLELFTRVTAVVLRSGVAVYLRQEFPLGPEPEVIVAYQDRMPNLSHIKNVTPALELAFQWMCRQRVLAEERAALLAARRAEELAKRQAAERMAEAMKTIGTGAGRRALAGQDFEAAARASLAISGAELLGVRPHDTRGRMVVQYRFRHRRLECVVEQATLRITDSGICLNDHRGESGDTYFTLESLPAVVSEAMRTGRLVVYRRAPGDVENRQDNNRVGWDDDDDF